MAAARFSQLGRATHLLPNQPLCRGASCRWLHRWMPWSVRAAGEDRPKDPHDVVDARAERQKQIRLGTVVLADRAKHAAGMLIAECGELVKVVRR